MCYPTDDPTQHTGWTPCYHGTHRDALAGLLAEEEQHIAVGAFRRVRLLVLRDLIA
jgi:hypothetical protein